MRWERAVILRLMALIGAVLLPVLLACASMQEGMEGMKMMVGQGGSTTSMTEIDRTLKFTARSVAWDEPIPAWQTPVFAAEVEDIVILGRGRALVSLLDLVQNFGKPVNGPYLLLDTATGRELWRYERNKSMDFRYDFIHDGSTLVVSRIKKGSLTYIGLDPGKGGELWSAKFDLPHTKTVEPARELLLVASSSGNKFVITALRLKDGAEYWKQEGLLMKGDPVPQVMISKDSILVVGRKVYRYALDGGARLSESTELGPATEMSAPLLIDDDVIVSASDGTIARVTSSGETAWIARLGAAPRAITMSKGMLFVNLNKDATHDRIAALDAATGKAVWNQETAGKVHSRVALDEHRLAYTLEGGGVEARDVATGKLLWNASIKCPAEDLPENIILYDKHLVIGTEQMVTALADRDGSKLWSFTIPPNHDYYDLSMVKQNLDSLAKERKAKRKEKTSDVVVQVTHEDYFKSEFIKTQERIVRDPASTHGEKIMASEAQINARRVDSAMAKSSAYMNLMSAMWALESKAPEIVEAMADNAKAGRLSIALSLVPKYHLQAVQGDWYVRPFMVKWDRYGLFVVNMRNGSWAEVTTCPYDLLFQMWAMQTQLAAMTPGGRLLVRGTGLDPDRWKDYVRWNKRIPSPAVLAYDLDKVSFKRPELYPGQPVPKRLKLLQESPYYVGKGSRVINLKPETSEDKIMPPGTEWVVSDVIMESLAVVDPAGKTTKEMKVIGLEKLRKVGAPWPPDFKTGEQLMIILDSGVIYLKGQSYGPGGLRKGDIVTVDGIWKEPQYILVHDAGGAQWLVPHNCVCNAPKDH